MRVVAFCFACFLFRRPALRACVWPPRRLLFWDEPPGSSLFERAGHEEQKSLPCAAGLFLQRPRVFFAKIPPFLPPVPIPPGALLCLLPSFGRPPAPRQKRGAAPLRFFCLRPAFFSLCAWPLPSHYPPPPNPPDSQIAPFLCPFFFSLFLLVPPCLYLSG